MFKRAFWLAVGTGFGFGASFWMNRAVRRTLDKWSPGHLSAQLAAAARDVGEDLQEAVADGQRAMRARESTLRRELGPPAAERASRGR